MAGGGQEDTEVLCAVGVDNNVVEAVRDVHLGKVDWSPARVSAVDLKENVTQCLTKLHGFAVG